MIFIAFILAFVFGSLGFAVTKNNARYLLSGYNTMSEQDRQAFDIDSYLSVFKRFHIFLGATLLGGVLLLSLVNNNWASMFMTIYPLCAYLYFLISTASRNKPSTQNKVGTYIAGGVLVITIAALIITSFRDYKSSEFLINKETIEITGSYGITLNKHEVQACQLVDKLPLISYKSNGFAAGDYAKGQFKTKDGRSVWLFVNKKLSPQLLIKSTKGDIYYNNDQLNMRTLHQDVTQWSKR